MKNCKVQLFYFIVVAFYSFQCIAQDPGDSQKRLIELYEQHCHQPSDINEHLPVLCQLASECSSAIEIGVRSVVSTWSILQGLKESSSINKSYVGIDLENPPADKLRMIKQISKDVGIDSIFWRINDMHIQIEPTDLLFIDSMHTYCHLTYELETFSPNIRKYICMHDTSEPWGNQDDNQYHGNYSEYPDWYDRTKRGLWPAVEDFLNRHPEWSLVERRLNNHGFTILKRNQDSIVKETSYHPDIDRVLKNHMILCTGPALHNSELLKQTTEADLGVIPFKKIYVATQDRKVLNVAVEGKDLNIQSIPNRGKQLDCTNCIIATLKSAVNDPDVLDEDIILFKHETVYLNDMGLVKKALSKILDGYDMVARSWLVPKSRTRGTDAFFVRVGAIRDLMKNFPLISEFTQDSTFCEEYFTTYIVNRLGNVYDVPYNHSNGWFSELGFYHIPSIGEQHRAPPWDKQNYDDLFRE